MSFDTRSKILTLEQARSIAAGHRRRVAFVSHVEVLQAMHVRKLEELAAGGWGTLFVVLTEPESPLVPLDARAEVAAGLRVVDYVVPASGGVSAALAAILPDLTVEDEEEDRERTRSLVEHVRSRARV
jgi:hypothetical protein